MKNNKYFELLTELRNNSRLPLTLISEKLQLPVTTTHDYYKRLRNYYHRHTSILNYELLGFRLRSILILDQVNTKKKLNFILGHKNTNNVYLLENNQIYLEAIFNSVASQCAFYDQIDAIDIKTIDEFKILEEIKVEEFNLLHNQIFQRLKRI
jgi:DNA-binding Lrp family transcriptional regulator